MEHFGSRDTGLPGPKGDCLSSQHHPGERGNIIIFLDFGIPVALGPTKGPEELAAACLPDAQAPPQWSNNLINRLKYCVLQLGDPDPNQDLVLGPS